MSKKKTFYEILDVPPHAGTPEILAAYRTKLQQLEAAQGRLSHEDYDFRLKLINLAVETLADRLSREAYDATLATPPTGTTRLSPPAGAVMLHPNADTLSRRADAMALRADAMALRADALSLRTDVTLPDPEETAPPSLLARVLAGLKSPLKRVLIALGAVAALGMVAQSFFVFQAVRKTEQTASVAARAEEQAIIQEHYQTYGVRPASAAEARMLQEQYRRQEIEQRNEERARQREEEEYRRFREESRRVGEQVAADLERAEEAARREEARNRERQEYEQRRQEEAENERIRRQKEEWRRVLAR